MESCPSDLTSDHHDLSVGMAYGLTSVMTAVITSDS